LPTTRASRQRCSAAAQASGPLGTRARARATRRTSADEENLSKLLAEVPDDDGDRRVAYVCALAYAEPSGETQVFTERCEGELAHEPRGDGGFGYDPAFIPADRDDGRTMAELTVEEKDLISHRGRAARTFLEWLGARV
jgi:XTP/dITP diphosphohydrolase